MDKIKWPYPILYGDEREVEADVLVLGGGIAGCWAAIEAARRGVKVALVEKGCTIKSGQGGMGCDHWLFVPKPIGRLTPEEVCYQRLGTYENAMLWYITWKDNIDTLLEYEKIGAKIRDTLDEFKGAPFRDEETKFLFAYDYVNRWCIRVWGNTFKPALYSELKRLGVQIYDRVMFTRLLTEGGRIGARVVGATGVHGRTGEFYIFRAKATVLATGMVERVYTYLSEYTGLTCLGPMNLTGDGYVAAWRAGAKLADLELYIGPGGEGQWGLGLGYPNYATGADGWGTWYACDIVDAKGKKLQWVYPDGTPIKDYLGRYKPGPGTKFYTWGGPGWPGFLVNGKYVSSWTIDWCRDHPDWIEAIRKGEITLPLYADLTEMPEYERRAIFGLMVGQEGKTWIAYRNLTQAGFDPDKDMLQCYKGLGAGIPPSWRIMMFSYGGCVVDWDLKTSLPGLYAAGYAALHSRGHSGAAVTGRWAGAKAAEYAMKAPEPKIDYQQVEAEKERVYEPVLNYKKGVGRYTWKEINAAISKIMREYVGERLCEELMSIGLIWLNELREGEMRQIYARNPHELIRVLEVFSLLDMAELITRASLARKSSVPPWFIRIDYPEEDPPEKRRRITLTMDSNGETRIGEMPLDYYLEPPFAPTLEKNYEIYNPWGKR
ncbi:MAG: FAD-dependent oxidoreductase [Candidatus Bathyarchaeia archaeon]